MNIIIKKEKTVELSRVQFVGGRRIKEVREKNKCSLSGHIMNKICSKSIIKVFLNKLNTEEVFESQLQ